MFFVWQTSAYGTGILTPDQPADIYRSRSMPCTPAGDLVGSFKTAREAEAMLPLLSDMTTQEAIAFIQSNNGSFQI